MADRMHEPLLAAGSAGSAAASAARVDSAALVQVYDLVVKFPVSSGFHRQMIVPVDHVSFHVKKGEVLSVVGESGSGKTTVARALIRVLRPDPGVAASNRRVYGCSGFSTTSCRTFRSSTA